MLDFSNHLFQKNFWRKNKERKRTEECCIKVQFINWDKIFPNRQGKVNKLRTTHLLLELSYSTNLSLDNCLSSNLSLVLFRHVSWWIYFYIFLILLWWIVQQGIHLSFLSISGLISFKWLQFKHFSLTYFRINLKDIYINLHPKKNHYGLGNNPSVLDKVELFLDDEVGYESFSFGTWTNLQLHNCFDTSEFSSSQ